MMSLSSQICLITLVIFISVFNLKFSKAFEIDNNGLKTETFLSPKFVMGSGSVTNKFYLNIDFPKGHIALKSFNAEVVDEAGNPVPLHETYLHHWIIARYHQRKKPAYKSGLELQSSDMKIIRNSGICDNNVLSQYFGLGSETRKTSTFVPDPYGIEVGNPTEIPPDHDEGWLLNVHAIDTRGVEDAMGCTECLCSLYNVTKDENGIPIKPEYIGGLRCCYDETQCRVKDGFEGLKRGLYMRYTVQWVDWDDYIVPVKIYIFDVTDTWNPTAVALRHLCKVEYNVESCDGSSVADNQCVHVKRTSMAFPTGGYVVYGVAHQHSGGIGSTLYGQDGRVICSSMATYGNGKEAGNEAGYIVGMSTCYPKPGSVKIDDGEILVLESNYSRSHHRMHTGVMGLFYILIAESPRKPSHFFNAPLHMLEKMNISASIGAVALLVLAVAVILGVAYGRRDRRIEGYEAVSA